MTNLAAAAATSSGNFWGTALGFVLIGVMFAAYWAPTIVVLLRKAPNAAQVAIVNFFLGWTFIGWIVALVMAVKPKPTGYLAFPPNQPGPYGPPAGPNWQQPYGPGGPQPFAPGGQPYQQLPPPQQGGQQYPPTQPY